MNLLLIILKSMAIGVIGSIPVGPIVMLSVQRSLLDGQRAGMQCAMGAILSDTVFAALALFAVRMTSTLLQDYSCLIQICGGIIIAGVGAGMLLSKGELKRRRQSRRHRIAETGKSMAMGFSNPGSFFWILAALTAIGVSHENLTHLESVCVVASVFAGSLLYWLILTYFAAKKGSDFSMPTLKKVSRIFGAVIILFGLFFTVRGVCGLK